MGSKISRGVNPGLAPASVCHQGVDVVALHGLAARPQGLPAAPQHHLLPGGAQLDSVGARVAGPDPAGYVFGQADPKPAAAASAGGWSSVCSQGDSLASHTSGCHLRFSSVGR